MSKPAGGGERPRPDPLAAGRAGGRFLRPSPLSQPGGSGEGRPWAAGVWEGGRGLSGDRGLCGAPRGPGAVVTAAVSLPAGKEPRRFGRQVMSSGA